MQAAVTHNVWYASRATGDPFFMQCTRCNQGEEPLLHRCWACPNLNDSDQPAIKNTQHLIPRAVAGKEDNAAFWLGCVLRGSMVNPMVGLAPRRDCITQTEGDFVGILRKTGVCGVDGSGGQNSSFPMGRSVGAGAGAALLRDHCDAADAVLEGAWMASKVLGRQTVPGRKYGRC